jgi:L,D-transpeptidase ErfK/SrfK
MRLGLPGYLIHGTNRPAGVGMRVTHGCIRMFPEDIEFLFDRVPVNASVRILNEPIKVGWDGDELVMEVHPVLEVAPAMTVDEPGGPATPSDDVAAEDTAADALAAEDDIDAQLIVKDPLTYATESFIVATRERAGRMDWTIVESLIGAASGMPARVGMSAPAEEDDGLVSQEQRAD